MNIKNGQHNPKAIVAANIVLCTCSIAAYLNKFCTLHELCSDICCIAEIILQRSIASTLYWTWLVRVLSGLFPACLSVCPGSECCLCCPLHLVTTELSVKFAKLNSEHEYGLDHMGGTRCCESNKSQGSKQ